MDAWMWNAWRRSSSTSAGAVALNEVLHPVHTTTPRSGARRCATANLLRMDWAFGEQPHGSNAPAGGTGGQRGAEPLPITADANHYPPKLPGTQGRNMLTAHLDVARDHALNDLL